MKNKTFWIGYAAVFVLLQVIGYLVHEVAMGDTYHALAAAFRPEEQMNEMMWIMMLSGVVVLFLFCYIFTKGREGGGIMEGVRYGALMGVFLGIPTSVDPYVLYPLTQFVAVVWLASAIVSFTIAGAVFAAIYKPSEN